jgi:hypothetical protein
MDNQYYIKIDAKGMHPESMDAADLGELISSFSKLFKHIDPELADDVRSSLVSIEDNCIKLGFALNPAAKTALAAFLLFANSETAPAIPYECNDSLRTINRITSSYEAEVEMDALSPNQSPVQFSKDKPLRLVKKTAATLKYETSIYGKIVQVGGGNPNIHILPLNGGRQVICDTSEELAIQAAKLLYQTVRVTGEAKEENGAVRMKAADITRFKGGSGNPFKRFEDLSLEDSLVAESVSEYLATLKEDDSTDG